MNIRLSGEIEGEVNLSIFNVLGIEIFQAKAMGGEKLTVNLGTRHSGVYFVHMDDGMEVHIGKIVKE